MIDWEPYLQVPVRQSSQVRPAAKSQPVRFRRRLEITLVNANILGLPNRPLDPTKLPMTIDLGRSHRDDREFPGALRHGFNRARARTARGICRRPAFSGSYPYCFDEQATVSGWRTTLRTFSSWDRDTLFIPGHGQICGQDGVTALSNIFDDLAAQVEKMHHFKPLCGKDRTP